jgi:hypothetical protein
MPKEIGNGLLIRHLVSHQSLKLGDECANRSPAANLKCGPCCISCIPDCESGGAGANPVGPITLMPPSSNRFRMRRFERRHVGAIPAGGTNFKTACSSI